jgi:ABC-type amino acid transport substrate-binding protein
MRYTSSFLLIYLLIQTHAISQVYKGDSWATVKTNGSGMLTVVYYEQPGLIQKIDGKMKGVCVDILADFAKYVKTKYGKTVEINYAGEEKEFSNFLKVSQSTPNIVGVTNTSITEERKKSMKFSPPYMNTPLVLLTHQNAPAIKNLSELPSVYAGFTAHVISGSTHVDYIQKIKKEYYPDLNVTYAPSSESVIKSLSSNPKIFSVLDFTEYVGVVRKKLPVKRQEVELGNAEPLGFVMAKQTDWDVLFNEFITADYRKSVEYKKIITENLGVTFLNLVR